MSFINHTSIFCTNRENPNRCPQTHIYFRYPPEDLYVDRVKLKRAHIRLVNSHWEEKGEDTEFLVEALIRNNRGAGLYLRSDRSMPIVWVLQQHYGGIGMVNTTKPGESQSRNLVHLLIMFMIRYYVIDGMRPFTCVLRDNQQLINTFMELGFDRVDNLFWVTTDGTTNYKYVSYYEKFQF